MTQPGSSIATSLSDGETRLKHVGVLRVHRRDFRIDKVALQTVRPFVLESIVLAETAMKPDDPDVARKVEAYCTERVDMMIERAGQTSSLSTPHLITPPHPSSPISTPRHLSAPLSTPQHPSAPLSTPQHPSPHHPSAPLASSPLITPQHPSAPSHHHPSSPLITPYHPSAPLSTPQHPSVPLSISTPQHPSPHHPSAPLASSPLITPHHPSAPLSTLTS